MCGIALVLTVRPCPCSVCVDAPSSSTSSGTCNTQTESPNFHHDLWRRLCQRGPDCYHHQLHRIVAEDKQFTLAMHSAVLHLRGDQVIRQPREDSDGNLLCWNGEIFGMSGRDISTSDNENQEKNNNDDEFIHGNDTVLLSQKLQQAGRTMTRMMTKTVSDPVVEVLRRVRGPFAVVWLHVDTQRVYFAHDRFGRRSLLYKRWETHRDGDMIAELAGTETASIEFLPNEMTRFVLSNVAIGHDDGDLMQYQELPASGIYVMDLHRYKTPTHRTLPSYRMEFHPYAPLVLELPQELPKLRASNYVLDRFGCKLPCNLATDSATKMLQAAARALVVALSEAVGVRVRSIPCFPSSDKHESTARVAVLFSGGLDSVVIAALTHFHAPVAEPIDLLTVCFDEKSSFASPDRRAAELAHAELCTLFPERQWNLVKVNVPRDELVKEQREIQSLMAPCDTHMDFNIGAAFWFLSRGRGVLTESRHVAGNATLEELNAFLKPQRADLQARVTAISLFDEHTANGGALLCPVAQCSRIRKSDCALGVCKTCCFRTQRAVNKLVPLEERCVDQREVQSCRAKLLAMGILEAQLDRLLSLARQHHEPSTTSSKQQVFICRVHRSKQMDRLPPLTEPLSPPLQSDCTSSSASPYQTNARVVLVGIGADEQLAGYGRHRTTLLKEGEQALRAELQRDLSRIWKRNLGRDDRCIAAHGREARFPYLDEHVVSLIATFPVSSLCDAKLPRGVGEKRALRLVAKTLGLETCAGLAKRAIQFGSRIAKVSNSDSNRQTHGRDKFASVE